MRTNQATLQHNNASASINETASEFYVILSFNKSVQPFNGHKNPLAADFRKLN